MHKLLAAIFVNVIGFFHFFAAAVFVFLIFLGIPSGVATGPLAGMESADSTLLIVFSIFAYSLFFGLLSVIIRMHQNLEKMQKTIARIADTQDLIADTFFAREEDEEDHGSTTDTIAP